jgi:outer membrane protein, adhesin transport system
MKYSIRRILFGATALTAIVLSVGFASAMTMKEAVLLAVRSNPEIGQAIANREGVQFELEQGRGLYRPRVDLEGSIGGEIRDSSSTRANGDSDTLFLRREASVVVRQTLFDGHAAKSEVERQASRVDGSSFRVRERSEFIALSVIHEYLEMERANRVIALAKENIAYHQKILGEIAKGAGGGAISIADRQQAQERVYAAKARLAEVVEELKLSQATFIKLVGESAGAVGKNIDVKGKLPRSLASALSSAQNHHPSIKFAQADIDAASAAVRGAQAKFSPNVGLEGRASAAQDVSGIRGFDGDVQGNVVLRWNIYNGGIDKANTQEQIRHVDEAYHALHRISSEVDEGVRHSWDRRVQQSARLRDLLRDLSAINELRSSYLQQFKIGERSLLDLLDTQNTRFSVQVAIATSDAAVKFSNYRLLASTGDLLHTIGIAPPSEAKPYGRRDYNVPDTPLPDSFDRIPATPLLE